MVFKPTRVEHKRAFRDGFNRLKLVCTTPRRAIVSCHLIQTDLRRVSAAPVGQSHPEVVIVASVQAQAVDRRMHAQRRPVPRQAACADIQTPGLSILSRVPTFNQPFERHASTVQGRWARGRLPTIRASPLRYPGSVSYQKDVRRRRLLECRPQN